MVIFDSYVAVYQRENGEVHGWSMLIDVDGRYSTKQNELLQDELVDEGYNLMKKRGEGHRVRTWHDMAYVVEGGFAEGHPLALEHYWAAQGSQGWGCNVGGIMIFPMTDCSVWRSFTQPISWWLEEHSRYGHGLAICLAKGSCQSRFPSSARTTKNVSRLTREYSSF